MLVSSRNLVFPLYVSGRGVPCVHTSHMQMCFESLRVWSVFRKGVVWREKPPGNVDVCEHSGCDLGGRKGWE